MRLRHQTLANDQRARAEVMGAKCDVCPLRDSGPCVFGDGPKDAKIALVGEGPGRAEVEVGKPFCLIPTTKVLMADCSWKELGDVKRGEKILTLEEEGRPVVYGVSNVAGRRWVQATVTRVTYRRGAARRVVTSHGDLVGSYDHRVLTARTSYNAEWVRLDHLNTIYESKHHSKLTFVGHPWERCELYDAGWLAGLLDGEGHVCGSHGGGKQKSRGLVGFSQNQGPIFDRAIEILTRFGCRMTMQSKNRFGKNVCLRVQVTGGPLPSIRLLGQVRPIRLIRDFMRVSTKPLAESRRLQSADVLMQEQIGTKDLIDITTTAGTFIANGFVAHNCGRSGEVLEELLVQLKIPRSSVYITNATLHFPPGGDLDVYITKKKKELGDDFVHPVDACRERLFYELRIPRCHTCGGYYVGSPEVRCNCARPVWTKRETPPPEVIIPMGNFALSALLGFTGISNWRGSIINIETWRKTGTAFEEVKTLSSDEFLKIARSA